MSEYGKPTDFRFGFNIHDFDPDREQSGKRTSEPIQRNYGQSIGTESSDSDLLVSEILAKITAITQDVKERGSMINYESGDGKSQTRRGQEAGGIPRLKMENLSFEKRTARVLAVREEMAYGESQVIVKIAFSNSTYLWYLKKKNPNLKFLVDSFGQDETKWMDEEFFLYLENDSFNNRNTIKTALVASVPVAKKR
jgi:hypothetical protein